MHFKVKKKVRKDEQKTGERTMTQEESQERGCTRDKMKKCFEKDDINVSAATVTSSGDH